MTHWSLALTFFLHSRFTVLFDSFPFLLFPWLALSFSRPLVRLEMFLFFGLGWSLQTWQLD